MAQLLTPYSSLLPKQRGGATCIPISWEEIGSKNLSKLLKDTQMINGKARMQGSVESQSLPCSLATGLNSSI
jgi:hypothetical protein